MAKFVLILKEHDGDLWTASYLLSAMSACSAVGAAALGWLFLTGSARGSSSLLGGVTAAGVALVAANVTVPIIGTATIAVGVVSGGVTPLMALLIVRRFEVDGYSAAYGLLIMCMVPVVFGATALAWICDASLWAGPFLAGHNGDCRRNSSLVGQIARSASAKHSVTPDPNS